MSKITKAMIAEATAENAAYDLAREQNNHFAGLATAAGGIDTDAEIDAAIAAEAPADMTDGLAGDGSDAEEPTITEAELTAIEETPVSAEPATDTPTFDQVMAGIDGAQVDVMVTNVAKAIDDRAEFEREKHGGESNIQKTLDGARKALITKAAAQVMLACNVDPSFVTRSIHNGQGYNVYAVQKVADIVRGLTDGNSVSNKINLAVMRTLFRFRASGDVFTSEIAKCCASDKVKPKGKLTAALVSHTVSASTASTQASSTMQALQTLGIVSASGASRSPIYTLTDHPAVAELEKRLAA